MTTAMMLNFATDYALQNDLTVEEAKTSQAYINMLMDRVAGENEGYEKETADFLRYGADLERAAD